jgi:hypothetical protein
VQFCVWLNPQLRITLDILFTIRAQFAYGFVITCGHHAFFATKYKLHSSKRFHRGFTQTYDVECVVLTDVSHILVRTPNFTSDCKVHTVNSQIYCKISHFNTLKRPHSSMLKYFRFTLRVKGLLNLKEFQKDSLIL